MKALALIALAALVTACGPSDGTHFADTEPLEGQADTGSDAGTDGNLDGPTDGGVGRQDAPSGSDGLGAAGTSGLGEQTTGSGGSGDSSGGASSTDSGSGGSSDGSGGSGAGGASSTDSGSSGGSGGSGDSSGDSSGGAGGAGSSSGGGAGGSDSTSGAGGGTDSCPTPRTPEANTVPNGSSGPFGSTEAVCYRLDFSPADYAGWGCTNAGDRTVTINGTSVSCGEMPMPEPVMGAYFFEFSAGVSANASFHWFNW